MWLSPNSLCCLRRRHLTDKLLPLRTRGPSHSSSTWITQESDIDLHGYQDDDCHSSLPLDSFDTADKIQYCDLHGCTNTDQSGRFGVKVAGRPRISPLSSPFPPPLGYILVPQRCSSLSLDASFLSPAVLSALEGVTYIAEHLRAEDADFSVSADMMTQSFCCWFYSCLTLLSVSTGEGGLEVRGHGCRPDLPVDVHYRVSAGDSGTLPASVAVWDVLVQSRKTKRMNYTIK